MKCKPSVNWISETKKSLETLKMITAENRNHNGKNSNLSGKLKEILVLMV